MLRTLVPAVGWEGSSVYVDGRRGRQAGGICRIAVFRLTWVQRPLGNEGCVFVSVSVLGKCIGNLQEVCA